MNLFDLKGCIAVVSGASGWLGSAMVEALSSEGAEVIAVARNAERLTAAAVEWPTSVELRTCDVTTPAWAELIADVASTHGRLDVLVNNANIGHGDSLRTATEERFDEAWSLSVKAAWTAMEAARAGFANSVTQGGSPSVINIASMYGVVAPDMAAYATEASRNPPYYGAAKAALLQLTRYAAAELGAEGIRVNSISPGPFPQQPESMKAEFLDELSKRTVLGRFGSPDEIKTAVLFLASRHSRFVTGSNVAVDGGWTTR